MQRFFSARLFWLWLPLGLIVMQFYWEFNLDTEALAVMHNENGFHELLQFYVLVAAVAVALYTLIRMDRRANKWLTGWIVFAALSCFYVAGEEVSWGQHFFYWDTPEYWAEINRQEETNLHNTSSWFNQKPRLVLFIGVIVGGLLVPALQRWRPQALPQRFKALYPPAELAVVAALVLFIKISDKLASAAGVALFERASEVEETYLYYFVLLYLWVMKNRCVDKSMKLSARWRLLLGKS